MSGGDAKLIRRSKSTPDEPCLPSSGFDDPKESVLTRRGFTWLAALGFVAPLVAYFWFIHQYGANMIWHDQWSDIGLISDSYTHRLTLSALWAPHYENRIFFPNLIVLLLAKTTHFNVHFEEYLSGFMLCAATGLLVLAHRSRLPSRPWIYYCPVAILMLSVVQVADTLWGFQMAWYLVMMALAVALFLLDRPTLTLVTTTGAIAAAVVGSFSSFEGLLIWPAGFMLIYCRRRPIAAAVVWTISGVLSGALYYYHFDFHSGYLLGTPFYAFHHPLVAIKFFLSAIGFSHVTMGLVILAVAIWVVVACVLRRDTSSGSPIGVALVCFGLLFTAAIAYGRAWMGAANPRYASFDLLIPVGCYLALLGPPMTWEHVWLTWENVWRKNRIVDPARADRINWSSGLPSEGTRVRASWPVIQEFNLVALAVLVCAISIQAIIGTTEGLASARSWHQHQVAAADVTVNIDKASDTLVENEVYVPVSFIRQEAQVARAHNLSLFATSAASSYAKEGLFTGFTALRTSMVIPSSRTSLVGTKWLDAVASDLSGVSKVEFRLAGSSQHEALIGIGRPSVDGWLLLWNTGTIANGTYTLQSIAYGPDGKSSQSRGVTITVAN